MAKNNKDLLLQGGRNSGGGLEDVAGLLQSDNLSDPEGQRIETEIPRRVGNQGQRERGGWATLVALEWVVQEGGLALQPKAEIAIREDRDLDISEPLQAS